MKYFKWTSRQLRSTARSCRGAGRRASSCQLHLEALEERLALATHTWTGAASDLWSTEENWMGGAPFAGEPDVVLTFPREARTLDTMDDIPGLAIQSIGFSGDHDFRPYLIRGNEIMLSGGMTVNGAGIDLVEVNIVLTGAQTFTVNGGPRDFYLRLRGVVSGSVDATLIKTGGGTLELLGANSYAGGTILQGGELEITNDAALGTGSVTVGSGIVRNEVRSVANSFTVIGALTIYQPDPSLDSNFSGDFDLMAGSRMFVAAEFRSITFSGVLRGNGSLVAGTGTVVLSRENTYLGSTTVNDRLEIGTDNAIPPESAVSVLGGTLDLNSFRSTIGSLASRGTVSIGSGTLTVGGTYTQTNGSTLLSGGTLAARTVDIEGGVLSGSGILDADVVNAGAINVGSSGMVGILTITGDYTQTETGALNIEISGPDAGTGYDQLQVMGLATLNGTLHVSLLGEFRPQVGDRFQILTFASVTSDFTTYHGLDLGKGLHFDPVFDENSLTLVTAGD